MTSGNEGENSGGISVRLSTTEYAVLGLLSDGPTHGFALAKRLEPEADIGRVFTVQRPLVYRALDRLTRGGYAEPITREKGEGPQRVIHQITTEGSRVLASWLEQPVDHVRDLRIEFLLKLELLRRSHDSPLRLIRDQIAALDPTLTALEDADPDTIDLVELWRRHNAVAAAAYLVELEELFDRDRGEARGL